MLHAAGVVATDAWSRLRRLARGFYIGNVPHTPRFELSQQSKVEEGCLSGYAGIYFQAKPESAIVKVRSLLEDYRARGVRALSRGHYATLLRGTPVLVADFLARKTVGVQPISSCSRADVHLVAEQPSRSNARIRIAESYDAVGMPRLALAWQTGDAELRTLTVVGRRLDALMRIHRRAGHSVRLLYI